MNARIRRTVTVMLLLLCGLVAWPAAAQQHPNIEKGFKPDHPYSVSDLDAVNLFNGNLNVSVPIGATYPVSEELSYSFTLAYAGNNWEYKHEDNVEVLTYMSPPNPPTAIGTIHWAAPYRKLNAGMGWLFSLGRLIPSRPDGLRWAYQAPDGSEHELFSELHQDSGIPTDPNVTYTRGSDYIRSTKIAGGFRLEFPDGTIREFGTDGRLRSIQDRFGNTVAIDYYATAQAATAAGVPAPNAAACGSTYMAWKIADPHRTHYAYFLPPTADSNQFSPGFEERVCQASLAAFGGNRADYRFTYAHRVISRQKVQSPVAYDETKRPSPALAVPLLTKVDLPSGSSYEMLYDIGMYKAGSAAAVGVYSNDPNVPNEVSDLALQQNPGSFSGHLASLTLPTKGRYEWDYARYIFPPKYGQVSDPMEPDELLTPSIAAGVKEKRKPLPNGEVATWTYAQTFLTESPWGRTTAITTVNAPDGSTTENYFSVFWEQSMERTNDYGAPFTRRPASNNPYSGMYLSSRTIVAGGERRTYVTYEQDPIADIWDSLEANRRLKSRLTVFEDNSETKEVHSSFDGLGHYRTTTATGTAGAVKRVTTRNYNPGIAANGSLPTTADWLTETYEFAEVSDLGANDAVLSKSRTELCFDTWTGRLLRQRAVRNTTASSIDLLTVYKDEDQNGQSVDGNVSQEEYYGGDDSPLGGPVVTSTCGAITSTHTYRLLHAHQYGSRKSTQYDGMINAKTLELTIDASTGLPSVTRDVAGVGTTMTYDLLGRLTSVTPVSSTERRVKSTYVYTEATATTAPSVAVQHDCPTGVATTCVESKLPEARYYYDPFGRLMQQRTSMGTAGTSPWSASTMTYDKAGRRRTSSVAMGVSSGNYSSITPPGFTVWDYDAWGRTMKITQPDGSAVDFLHTSPSVMARTAGIATVAGETPVTTVERSDAWGRLVQVTEDSTAAALDTFYRYDSGDRLIEVTDALNVANRVQTRTFEYDGAGLLTREDHPESGATSYKYDAHGHVTRRITGAASNGSTLIFDYDPAERLLTVDHDPDGDGLNHSASPLKVFQYGLSGTRLGRLWTAKRYNYNTDFGGTGIATVTETFSYDASGLLSSKTTLVGLPVGGSTTFTDSYTSDVLGALETVTYPNCTTCGTDPRTVQNFYDHGYLKSVGTYASNILYHPNGLWSQFSRPKVNPLDAPIVESQTVAANQMSRPGSRSVSGYCPAITVQGPDSRTVDQNEDSNLSVTAPAGSTFQWYAGDAAIQGATSSALHVPVTTTTTYWVRVARNGCTVDSTKAVVTVNACPTPTISAPASVAMRQTATASVPQSGTYLWTITNGTIVNNTSTQQQVQFMPGCSGSVTLEVTVTRSCSSNPVTVSKTVPVDVPAVSLSADPTAIAQGGTSTLHVGVNTAGTWTITWADYLSASQVNGSLAIPVTPESTRTYEVAEVNGCSMSPWAAATVTVRPPAPLTTTATMSGPTSVLVSWTKAAGAVIDSYRIERCASGCTPAGPWVSIGSTPAMTFNDVTTAADASYAYRVVSVTAGTESSGASPPDFASTHAFTDDPLAALGTQRVRHVTQLRAAVNALRATAGLPAYSFTDTLAVGSLPKAIYLIELKTAVDPARAVFNRPAIAFTTPAPAFGGMPLAAHVNELRGGVQ